MINSPSSFSYNFDVANVKDVGVKGQLKVLSNELNLHQYINREGAQLSVKLTGKKIQLSVTEGGKKIYECVVKTKNAKEAINCIIEYSNKKSIKELAKELTVVNSIKKTLDKSGSVMVFGAPSSGKTEQLQIALGKKIPVFDLRAKFIESYCHDNGITNPKDKAEVKDKYKSLKQAENEWIGKNKNKIIQEFKENPEQTLVIDEFDLAIGSTLNQTELATAKSVLEIAKSLKESGKQIVVIMHSEGLHSPSLLSDIEKHLGLTQSHLVQTKFLSPQEQGGLLKAEGFSEIEIKNYQRATLGIPAAYLELIKSATPEGQQKVHTPLSYAAMLTLAADNIAKVYKVTKSTYSPQVIALLQDLALGHRAADDPDVLHYKSILLETGLAGLRGQKLVVPPLVSEVISKQEKKPLASPEHRSRHSVHVADQNIDFRAIARHRTYEKAETEKYIATADKYGGHVKLELLDKVFIVPKNPSLVNQSYKESIGKVAKQITIQESKKEQDEAKKWVNSANSVPELMKSAQSIKQSFIQLSEQLAMKYHGRAYFGPDYKFVLKSEQSLKLKIATDAKELKMSEEDALRSIGDAIRGTIVIENISNLQEIISGLQAEFATKGWKISFKNIWEGGRPGGYVGVHAKLNMVDPEGNHVIGELQLHLPQIYNGTLECVKESNHEVYEYAREAFGATHKGERLAPPPFANDISRLQFLSHIEDIT